jgi:hypothetical protein
MSYIYTPAKDREMISYQKYKRGSRKIDISVSFYQHFILLIRVNTYF